MKPFWGTSLVNRAYKRLCMRAHLLPSCTKKCVLLQMCPCRVTVPWNPAVCDSLLDFCHAEPEDAGAHRATSPESADTPLPGLNAPRRTVSDTSPLILS